MKRIFLLITVLVFLMTLVAACAGAELPGPQDVDGGEEAGGNILLPVDPPPEPEGEPVSLSIVTTIFPQYDWVRQILGHNAENMDITFVINSMIDLHSFNPTFSDMIAISTSDLFIYVGGESDDWVDDALSNATNPDMIAINLMEILGEYIIAYESACDGHHHHGHACDDEDCDHCHGHHHDDCDDDDCDHCHGHHHDDCDDDDCDHCHGHHHHYHIKDDEHVWMSIRASILLVEAIAEALITLDPANAELYTANMNAYIEELRQLDQEYTEMIAEARLDTLVFGDRFPFRYLMYDYNLHYYAAFPGCHAEAEASFSTIIHLAGVIDEHQLHTVVVSESADKSIATTIINNTESGNQQILVLDSLQSVTTADAQAGLTFLAVMRENLEILREALR